MSGPIGSQRAGKQEGWIRREIQRERNNWPNPSSLNYPLPNTPTSALKMEVVCFSETLVSSYESTQSHNLDDEDWHIHCCENYESHKG
jgi:hypothetical protein